MKIQMKGKTAEVLIYEDIGGWFGITADQVIREIKALGDVSSINLRLNSNGGSVFDGVSIYNYLKSHKASIEVDIDGIAASIASIIAQAADPGKLRIADNAWMMIHNPWIMTAGEAKDLRKTADTMDGIRDSLLDTYMKRTSLEREKVSDMMDEETWLNGVDAVEFGFADEMTGAMEVAAHVHKEWFKNPPKELIKAEAPKPAPDLKHIKEIVARQQHALRKHNIKVA